MATASPNTHTFPLCPLWVSSYPLKEKKEGDSHLGLVCQLVLSMSCHPQEGHGPLPILWPRSGIILNLNLINAAAIPGHRIYSSKDQSHME